MADKIIDIEERISRSLQESLDELYLIRQEESGHLESVKERVEELSKELRELAIAIDKATKDYDQSREELMASSRRGAISDEKRSYEKASSFMKVRGSLEERYRLLGEQKEELKQEERRLNRLVQKSEKMGNRLRMVLNLIATPEDFSDSTQAVSNTETLCAAFQLAENESVTFARELHDGPTQTFSAVGLMLEMGKEFLARGLKEQAEEEISRALEQTHNGLNEIRAFLFSLSPTGIQDGLELPLKRLASQIRQMWGCKLSYTLKGDTADIPANIRIGSFKTLHQAVVNAARHGASEVKAVLSTTQKTLKVRISDDGKGFDVEYEQKAAKERGSYGLLNMEERVKMMGGKFSISSTIGKGSIVSFSVPLLH